MFDKSALLIQKMTEEDREKRIEGLKECCTRMLDFIGEDVGREGLVKTPERVARAILDTTAGYYEDPEAILRKAMFKEDYSQMVIVKDIDFYSLCEHHILPFFGKVHVAYIPNGYITGLSKIARVVEAQHMCMQMRGVKKQNSITTTSDFCGAFNQAKTREEFMNLLRNK